jgi:hypothetical protein
MSRRTAEHSSEPVAWLDVGGMVSSKIEQASKQLGRLDHAPDRLDFSFFLALKSSVTSGCVRWLRSHQRDRTSLNMAGSVH